VFGPKAKHDSRSRSRPAQDNEPAPNTTTVIPRSGYTRIASLKILD
jgi:hypothetical protein